MTYPPLPTILANTLTYPLIASALFEQQDLEILESLRPEKSKFSESLPRPVSFTETGDSVKKLKTEDGTPVPGKAESGSAEETAQEYMVLAPSRPAPVSSLPAFLAPPSSPSSPSLPSRPPLSLPLSSPSPSLFPYPPLLPLIAVP